jgi:hypothetical protein
VLAFRIFVMLSCLIIVPMAAIFGSAFPDVVKSVLVDRIVAWSTGKPYEPAKSNTGDGFSEVAATGHSSAPPAGNNWEAPRWPQGGSVPAATQAGGVVPAAAANVQGGVGNQPANFVAPSEPPRVAVPGAGVSGDGSAAAATPPAPRPLDTGDRFTAMERKLRQYGATYYLLETWGNEGQLYRFHCRMAISNNPNYTRQFEATDRDALRAMSQVVERVEAWRAGRLQ